MTDREGRLWYGTSDGIFGYYKNGKLTNYSQYDRIPKTNAQTPYKFGMNPMAVVCGDKQDPVTMQWQIDATSTQIGFIPTLPSLFTDFPDKGYIRIDGRIKVPGEYPLEPGMKVSDLIRAGGSLQDAAYGGTAELVRYKSQDGESRKTDLVQIDLAAVLSGDPKADVVLQPFDLLSIKELPQWSGQENVTLLGEVRFPGKYAIKRGETLSRIGAVARVGITVNEYARPVVASHSSIVTAPQ